jgi:hypothetical protein
MGGRGSEAAAFGPGQGNLWLEEKHRIEQGRIDAEILHGIDGDKSKEIITPIAFKTCTCCNEYTIPFGSTYERCPLCNWIDDPYQNMHPESKEGKNAITLSQAKALRNSNILG